jgi:hypothetical protein
MLKYNLKFALKFLGKNKVFAMRNLLGLSIALVFSVSPLPSLHFWWY